MGIFRSPLLDVYEIKDSILSQVNWKLEARNAKQIRNLNFQIFNLDGLVKSQKTSFSVIPAKAGIQFIQLVTEFLDSGFHRSDDFLRNHKTLFHKK